MSCRAAGGGGRNGNSCPAVPLLWTSLLCLCCLIRRIFCLYMAESDLFLPFAGHSKARGMYFSQILWGIITNKWQRSEPVQTRRNYTKWRLETTCKCPNCGGTANVSNIIMVVKREQCTFKNWFLKKSVIFEGISVFGCEGGKIELGLLFIKHGYLQIFDCCSTGQLWKFFALSRKMKLVRACFGFNYCSHC